MQTENNVTIEEIEQFQEEYNEYAVECKCAIRILRAKFDNLRQTGDISFNYYDRIKSYESLIDKCDRRGYETNMGDVKKKVRDIAAMRVVTIFRDDIYKMVEDIRLFPGVSIVDEDDYVKNPKDNGYSSYHITVIVENTVGRVPKKTPVEIQVRDNAMEFWAQMEHEIFYKKDHKDAETEKALKEIADNMTEAAELAVRLRDNTKAKKAEADAKKKKKEA